MKSELFEFSCPSFPQTRIQNGRSLILRWSRSFAAFVTRSLPSPSKKRARDKGRERPGTRFSKLPVITGPVKLFCFPFQRGVSKLSFEYYTVKLLAKETKWTLSEFRIHPTFLEILISKSDSGPVKLPGLSRNGPLLSCFVSIPDGSFKRFESCTVKLSAKETICTSLEVRTHPTFLESLILKYDFGPVKLPGTRVSKDPVT